MVDKGRVTDFPLYAFWAKSSKGLYLIPAVDSNKKPLTSSKARELIKTVNKGQDWKIILVKVTKV